MVRRLALMLIVVALASGCTAAMHPRPPISIPPNLSQRDAESIILSALTNQPLPPDISTSERIADQALQAFFGGRYQSVSQSPNRWFFESFEPRVIYAGYKLHTLYLRVAMRFEEHTVTTQIVDSKNLHQGEDRIHPTALLWVDELETGIRRVLGSVAAARKLTEDQKH